MDYLCTLAALIVIKLKNVHQNLLLHLLMSRFYIHTVTVESLTCIQKVELKITLHAFRAFTEISPCMRVSECM